MKTNSKQPTRIELIVMAAILFLKSLLTQPFYKKLFGFADTVDFVAGEILTAAGAIVLSVIVSVFLVKTASKIGENAKVLMILAVAEPMLISTLGSAFHALAAVIAVICAIVCIRTENRILPAILTVAASAAISFIMPCSVFSFVLLVIIVLLITTPKDTASKIISLAGAALSVAATNVCVQLSDVQLRVHFKLYDAFDKFGGHESHTLNFDKLETFRADSFFSSIKGIVVASLPIIAFVIFIIVKTVGFKEKKEKAVLSKILTVSAFVIPFAAAIFAATICTGKGYMTGFCFIPLVITVAFASKGNKYVLKALEDIAGFAKAHPIAAVIAIIWLASYTAAFAVDDKVFSLVTQFAM